MSTKSDTGSEMISTDSIKSCLNDLVVTSFKLCSLKE